MRARLLGVAVGLALADSSIVTLALPEILGQFDVAITSVAWVLTSFNLVLALLAVPAAYVSRRRPREAFVTGSIVFAGASLACGLAPSFDVLVVPLPRPAGGTERAWGEGRMAAAVAPRNDKTHVASSTAALAHVPYL